MRVISQVGQPVNTFDVLDSGVEQLREELAVFKAKLSELYVSVNTIGKDCTEPDWYAFLHKLKENVAAFMGELACHSGWEDEVLLPVIASFTGVKKSAVMRYDYEIAVRDMQRFIEFVEGLRAPVRIGDAKRAAKYVITACSVLNERFQVEEKVLFPLAEEMLRDVEQFFS